MIEKIKDERQLVPWQEDPIGCRLCSAASAYGVEELFAQFWLQNEDTLLGKIDDALVLCPGSHADWEELAGFLPFLGAGALLCPGGTAARLSLPAVRQGWVMTCQNKGGAETPSAEWNPSLREMYALLAQCETETFRAPEFEAFYLDMSHRTRHGAAVSAGLRLEGRLAAAAICAAKTEGLAVISGVAVLPEFRRQGLGRAVVQALAAKLPQPVLCVFRAEGENRRFYEGLGFQDKHPFEEASLTGR